MAKTLDQLEADLKRDLNKAYKEVYGKGPGETLVKIWGNVIIMKFDGALTHIEESLRLSNEGNILVDQMRDTLVFNKKNNFISLIEEVLSVKVTDISYILGKEDNTLYLFAILEEKINLNA